MDTWKHLSKQNEGALDSYAIYLLNPGHCARLQSDQLLRLKNANDQKKKKKKLSASLSSFRLFLSGSFCETEGGLASSSARLVAAARGPGRAAGSLQRTEVITGRAERQGALPTQIYSPTVRRGDGCVLFAQPGAPDPSRKGGCGAGARGA